MTITVNGNEIEAAPDGGGGASGGIFISGHLQNVQVNENKMKGIIGRAIEIHQAPPPLMDQLGLPLDTNAHELAELLRQLLLLPEQDREPEVKRSGLFANLISKGADATSFVSNILTIANDSNVANLLHKLVS